MFVIYGDLGEHKIFQSCFYEICNLQGAITDKFLDIPLNYNSCAVRLKF